MSQEKAALTTSGKKCPAPGCDKVFQGEGWGGIDAHWRAHHLAICSYEDFRHIQTSLANQSDAKVEEQSTIPSWSDLQRQLRAFAKERDWEKFHSPKNLTMALSVEVSELVEVFQWMTEQDSKRPDPATLEAAAHEIADVQIYLARIADVLGINLQGAVEAKMKLNAIKHPPLSKD